jgi:hypothetical protein
MVQILIELLAWYKHIFNLVFLVALQVSQSMSQFHIELTTIEYVPLAELVK